MKQTTITPEQFAKGSVFALGRRAIDVLLGRKSKQRRPYVKSEPLPMQVGTITPEDFGVGRPFWGHRARGHRSGPVNNLKPLDVVEALLDS